MIPQERELLTGLFDRLATLENQPRDPEAERAIIEGLRRAPNATYALVQTALVQDEALTRANARIQALEARLGEAPVDRPAGFLDSMREALLGPRAAPRGSVPTVHPREQPQDQGAAGARSEAGLSPAAPAWRPATGGSFLGNAAAAAAGVIGGALLLDGIRSMMWHGGSPLGGGPFGFADPAFGAGREFGSPWDNAAASDLARQAGIDDIGGDLRGSGGGPGFGLFDNSSADDAVDFSANQNIGALDDSGSDFGGSDFGGGDFSGDV